MNSAFRMGQLAQLMTWEGAEASRDAAVLTRQEQFTALVHRQSSFVFRIVFAVLRNTHDAEDAVQATFLKIFRQGSLEQIADERAYLACVAWRIAVSRRGKQVSFANMPEQASPQLDPEQASASADWNAHVRALIDSLPSELRDPLRLSAIEEFGSDKIAVALGIPEGTVRNRIFRARQMLKRKMASLRARDVR